MTTRALPCTIQSFKKIRTEGYVYVDKTDLVWQLVNQPGQFYYLSRPRRFGKSILVDTLECYLTGRKELFDGLKIMDMEAEWKCHPIIRFDMSGGGASERTLTSYLKNLFRSYEKQYNVVADPEDSLAVRFDNIIKAAYEQTGEQVGILIDEYDSPLQHSWKTPEHEACTAVYREVFAVLKMDSEYEKIVFITGITKFTQISLFSVLNNLYNISFDPEFATICGITEQEILDNFQPELQRMAECNGWTMEETHKRLKEYYDGYHFCSRNMVDIYNPYSLVNALKSGEIRNFWAASGATTLLPKFIADAEIRMRSFEECRIQRNTIETSDVVHGGVELFLYQSGYLTIKGNDEFGYILGFPNIEVKQALYESVLPALTLRQEAEVQSLQANLYYQFGTCQLDAAKRTLKSLIADVPYSNKKLESMNMEERYRLIISSVLNAVGFRVEVERMLATGRIDLVTWTSRYIYVIELKLQNNGGMAAAAKQIEDCQYLEPFKGDGRKVVGLAVELDDLGKGLLDWQVVE
jgi:hypothetical protein